MEWSYATFHHFWYFGELVVLPRGRYRILLVRQRGRKTHFCLTLRFDFFFLEIQLPDWPVQLPCVPPVDNNNSLWDLSFRILWRHLLAEIVKISSPNSDKCDTVTLCQPSSLCLYVTVVLLSSQYSSLPSCCSLSSHWHPYSQRHSWLPSRWRLCLPSCWRLSSLWLAPG